MTTRVALLGAGGKMGCRITDRLKNNSRYDMRYVEPSEQGQERLAEQGVSAIGLSTGPRSLSWLSRTTSSDPFPKI